MSEEHREDTTHKTVNWTYRLSHAVGQRNKMRDAINEIKRATQAAQIDEAVEKLGGVKDVKLLTTVISSYRRVGRVDKALDAFEAAKQRGLPLNGYSYGAAISACARDGQWQRALELLEEMRQQGIAPNVISYSAAMAACESSRQWKRALELFDEMRKRGVAPDVYSYRAAILACERDKRWQRALDLFREMKQRNLPPDAASYSKVISVCELAGESSQSMDVFLSAIDLYSFIWEKGLNTLDLHSLTPPIARTAVRIAFEDYRRGIVDDDDAPLNWTLITGAHDAVLRPALLAMFRDEYRGQLECDQLQATPRVITVSGASLRRFFAAADHMAEPTRSYAMLQPATAAAK